MFRSKLKIRFQHYSFTFLDGDGEAVLHPKMVKNVSLQFLNYLIENSNRAGLDGVDLATVMPKLKNDKWIKTFQE